MSEETSKLLNSIIHGRTTRLAGSLRYLLEDFALLELHRKAIGEFFSSEKKALDKRWQDEFAGLTPAQKAEYEAEHLIDETWLIEKELPKLQWYAQFLVVFGTAEAMLNKLCAFVRRRSKLSVSHTDMRGQGIERAALYLKKVVGVEAPFDGPEWQKVRLLAEIRSVIAHGSGEFKYDPKEKGSLYLRLQKIDGLKTIDLIEGDTAEISIDSTFVKNAIKDLRALLTLVADYELYPESKAASKP